MTEPNDRYGVGLRRLISPKLGSCPKCMRLSLTLALASWVAVAAAVSLVGEGGVLLAVGAVAIALTALFAAHLLAFFVKSARWWRAQAAATDGGFDDGDNRSRRKFLTVSGTLLGAALFAPLLRTVGSDAVAKKSITRINCQEGPPWFISLTAPLIVGCGAESPGRTPGENALQDYLAKVRAACRAAEPQDAKKGVCEQRSCKQVVQTCVVRRPAGADFKNEDLVLRAKQAGDPCGAAATHVLFYNGNKKKYGCNCDCV
jgi:hypothetical protein